MVSRHSFRIITFFAAALVTSFWVFLFLYPALMLLKGITPHLDRLFDAEIRSVVSWTLWQALLSMFFSILIGFPLGWMAGELPTRWRRRVEWIWSLPFSIPGVIAAIAWVIFLGRYGWAAIILAHIAYNAPWIAWAVSQARSRVSVLELQTAQTLGANSTLRFQKFIWPELWPSLASAALQSFVWCVSSFSVVLILGGGPPVETLEVALYSSLRYGMTDRVDAAALALWQLALVLTAWGGFQWSVVRKQKKTQRRHQPERFILRPLKLLTTLGWGIIFLWPVLFLVGSWLSYIQWGNFFTSESFQELSSDLHRAVLLSLIIALSSAVLGAVIALCWIWMGERFKKFQSLCDGLALFPSGLSALALAVGIWLSVWGQNGMTLLRSFIFLILIQALLFSPIAFRLFWSLRESSDRSGYETALTLGASPFYAFWIVEWPKWSTLITHSILMCAAAALGDLGLISFFSQPDLLTLPLAISRLFSQYRFEEAQLLSVLLLALAFGLIGLSRVKSEPS